MKSITPDLWKGLRESVRGKIESRDYSEGGLAKCLATSGVSGRELVESRGDLAEVWIPGVEVFQRNIYQQKGRGYFSELVRLNESVLAEIGLVPQQWASALMHRDSVKGFHVHPPYIPENISAGKWFEQLFIDSCENYSLRAYDKEQWDVMFFLMGLCEMILIDEREGMSRRIMRFTISGDNHAGADNVAVVIPPGVGHALRSIGNEDLIMIYGTSTCFNPDWEGRISSDVEKIPLPTEWLMYLAGDD